MVLLVLEPRWTKPLVPEERSKLTLKRFFRVQPQIICLPQGDELKFNNSKRSKCPRQKVINNNLTGADEYAGRFSWKTIQPELVAHVW